MSEDTNAQIGAYAGARGPDLPDGHDRFLKTQQPDFDPVDDLTRFVLSRIIELELGPRGEIDVFRNPEQAMAYRYARQMRADCIVFRRIVAAYLGSLVKSQEAEDTYGRGFWEDHAEGLRVAVLMIANRWSTHHEFQAEWSLA